MSIEADPLLILEGILDLGTKASTYKYALIRAITDYLIENPVQAKPVCKIPITWIALKWIDYYWPLTIPKKIAIPQAVKQKGKRDTLTQAFIEEYQKKIENLRINFEKNVEGRLDREVKKRFRKKLSKKVK